VIKVVDASALAAVLFGEDFADAVAASLGGAELVAPHLLDFELANICLTKMQRAPELRESMITGYRLHRTMGIQWMEVDHAQVLALAEHAALTAYDASYLWLARELGCELVTLDRQLASAAEMKP
jgi:predicted nucleic acid-binding protein